MEVRLEITGLVFGGSGMGRMGESGAQEAGGLAGKVVFVPFTAPGDEVTAKITRDTKGFCEGELTRIIRPSPSRTEPVCLVFGRCGGCSYQHISYEEEVRWKERIFLETLQRIGRLAPERTDPPVPSPEPYGYRLRARFHADGSRWGFFARKTNDVVDIEECPLLHPLVNETFRSLKEFFVSGTAGEEALDSLYSIEIGLSQTDARTAALLSVRRDTGLEIGTLLARVPPLKGVEVATGAEERPKERVKRSEGDVRLLYSSGGFDFSAPVGVFSQVNAFQNEALIARVVEYAAPAADSTVLDLYSGMGNLTLPLAAVSGRVTGIESDAEAVEAARMNAEANTGRGAGDGWNVEFVRDWAGRWLEGGGKALERDGVDVVVLDPPRGGDKGALQTLAGLRPGKVVYVSCNPPTLARDLQILKQNGYRPTRASIVDMFPRTSHIEGIVLMEPEA